MLVPRVNSGQRAIFNLVMHAQPFMLKRDRVSNFNRHIRVAINWRFLAARDVCANGVDAVVYALRCFGAGERRCIVWESVTGVAYTHEGS